MKYQGATCAACIHEDGAKRGDKKSALHCVKCVKTNGRPGFSPKNSIVTVQVETVQGPMRRIIHG